MYRTNGFSLVELIIAMALVAIVSALAIPQFQRYADNNNLKTAAREVAADLFNARQRAVAENRSTYEMMFDLGANSYALTRTDTAATLWTKSLASFGSGTQLTEASFGGTIVRFNKRGTVTVGHVALSNRRASTAKVTTTFTGRTYAEFTMQ
ncbi:MAG: prepilin-type N-terminal cleavage/methylation domain-containing protein [Desulfococcus multivorans]|jgi:prepilin-type N-terminal cleavage/methylation domain-containing protein|nr:prepilin-type N-terminal cleavage/methylation domain-containing protein [Desulfococcus multivorans]